MRMMILFPLTILFGLPIPEHAVGDAVEISGATMGTYFRIVVDSPKADFDPVALKELVEGRLTLVNRQMSTWDDKSEISAFNASKSTDWFAVSPEFAGVSAEAKRIFEITEGAFDPTVESLIRLWGFGDSRKKTVPGESQILAAKAATGMKHFDVRIDPPAIKKSIPELQLNLSAIAKGYAVDVLAELMIEQGLSSFVVDIGGENRAGGAKASGSGWKLGVESPLGGLQRVVELTDSSIATSGDYRNFFQLDGITYSHAIDPSSGWPVKDPPASVSVVCPSCMTADAFATAMMVLGVKKGIAIAEANGLSVLFQTVAGDTVSETASGPGFVGDSDVESENVPGEAVQLKTDSGAAKWFPFAAAAVIFLIAVGGMAIGTMLQNKSLKGSCGGLASMPGNDGKSICELCTIPKDQCTNAELKAQMQAAAAGDCEHDAPAQKVDATD